LGEKFIKKIEILEKEETNIGNEKPNKSNKLSGKHPQ
jgi:uncharacterized protein (UPF0335 family)